MIYLDNAASSFPKPKAVIKAIYRSLKTNTANPGRSGHFLSAQAARSVYLQRVAAAGYFGCKEENVIFTLNATHSINTALKGILKSGDRVLISDLEHNSVLRPLVWMKENSGISFEVVKTDLYDDEKTVKAFEEKITPDTRLVFCTHASNVTGKILPVDKIGLLCKSKGCLFFTDASQTAGFVLPENYDILCTSGHKGLYGPQGTGLLIIKNTDILTLTPVMQGGTGTNSLDYNQPDILPESLESGTLNTPGIIGLGTGIRYVMKNHDKLVSREKQLFDEGLRMLSALPGIILYSGTGNSTPMLSFNVKGVHSDEVTEYLNDNGICVRGGFHCAVLAHEKLQTEKTGIVRASIGAFNNIREIEEFICILNKFIKIR
jgi:cysteine desulfurase family protein